MERRGLRTAGGSGGAAPTLRAAVGVPPFADPAPFRWQDGERTIVFGADALARAGEDLGEGYALLTTERAARSAPEVLQRAGRVHHVRPGRVDEIAAELRAEVRGELLVALGGGRVIDTAKALAAAAGEGGGPAPRVAAIPTTLSGAEMTAVHRQAVGVGAGAPRVRPALVLNDPARSASQPESELAASVLNALGHAAEAPLTPLSNPVSTLAALDAARRLVGALAPEGVPRRDELALGALLAGYSIDSAGYGLHHVLSQTLVRLAGVSHGQANAALLPHTLGALAERFPAPIARFGEAMGGDPSGVCARLAARAGARSLRALGVSSEDLDRCASEAARRPELALTPPAAERAELRALYEAAL